MSEPALDIQGLLRALVEQQTALLGVQAESVRLQRVLMERLLASGQTLPVTAEAPPPIATQTPHASSEPIATTTPAVEPVVRVESVPVVKSSAPTVPTVVDGPVAESEQPIAPVSAPTAERPALRVVGGPAAHGERYYQSARPTPVQRISAEGLDVLKRIQSAGEVAQLILVFGSHAGETLGHVAQSDPDYVRRLAFTAERPDVRAAPRRWSPRSVNPLHLRGDRALAGAGLAARRDDDPVDCQWPGLIQIQVQTKWLSDCGANSPGLRSAGRWRCTHCVRRQRRRAGRGLPIAAGSGVFASWPYEVSAIGSPTRWILQGERSGAKRFLVAAIGSLCRRWFRQPRARTRTLRQCCHLTCTDNVRSLRHVSNLHTGHSITGTGVSSCYHHVKRGNGCETCNGWLCTSLPSHMRCTVYRCTTNSNSLSSCYSKTIGLSSMISSHSRPMSFDSAHAGVAD